MGGGAGGAGGAATKPPIEPVKSAEEIMKSASDSSNRAAQLRRGIASTFSRPTMENQHPVSATSGSAAKLGG